MDKCKDFGNFGQISLHFIYNKQLMIREKNPNQLKFEAFKTPFESQMKRDNRWVKLAESLPWEELIKVYAKSMSDFGRPALSPRVAIGALIIKTMLGLSDEETVAQIQENMYMQYFLGLEKYQEEPLFDPSLLVHFRERMGKEIVDQMNGVVVVKAIKENTNNQQQKARGRNRKDQKQPPGKANGLVENKTEEVNSSSETRSKESVGNEYSFEETPVTHKGHYILDATIADQYIKYPTDVDLLNKSREHSEEIIDILYKNSTLGSKPRTYRKVARAKYLDFAKSKKKTIKAVKTAQKQQLNYLRRNLQAIEMILQTDMRLLEKLDKRTYRTYLVIQEIYSQQNFMVTNKVNRCDDRIVSISQPYVRPMVRGKQGKNVEFGAKILVGITEEGYSFVPKMEWDQFNEGSYVLAAVEDYKNNLGYYPEVVIGDQIFISRANKQALEKLGIRLSGKSLGRKNQEEKAEEAERIKEEQKQRVKIEGKFGQGKNGYELNKIRMRKSNTSESMVYMIFFVMNLVRYAKEVLFWPFLKTSKFLENILKKLVPPPGSWLILVTPS